METVMEEHENDSIWQSLYDQHCYRKPGGMSRSEYAKKFDCSYDQAKRILDTGVEEGRLKIEKNIHMMIYYPVE